MAPPKQSVMYSPKSTPKFKVKANQTAEGSSIEDKTQEHVATSGFAGFEKGMTHLAVAANVPVESILGSKETTTALEKNEIPPPEDGKEKIDPIDFTIHEEEEEADDTAISQQSDESDDNHDATSGLFIRQSKAEQAVEYPHPTVVLKDKVLADQLASSGLLDQLISIPVTEISELKTLVVSIGSRVFELSPYFQVTIKMMNSYYQSLNNIGYCYDSLDLMHYTLKLHLGKDVSAFEKLVVDQYTKLENLGMEDYLAAAGVIFIGQIWAEFDNLKDSIGYTMLARRVDEVKKEAPFIYGIYNVIGHFMEGGQRFIDPIPPMIQYHAGLSAYINGIAHGEKSILDLHVIIQTRSKLLAQGRYKASRLGNPTKQAAVEKDTTMKKKKEIQIIPQLGETQAETPQAGVGHDAGVSKVDDKGRKNNPKTTDKNLAEQGKPEGKTVIRDTTTFRSNLDAGVALFENVDEMKELIKQCDARSEARHIEVIEEIRSMREDMSKLDATFSIFISQASASNLGSRAAINSTLLVPQDPRAEDLLSRAVKSRGISQEIGDDLISRVEKFDPSKMDSSAMAAEVKAALNSGGEAEFAENVTSASFKNHAGRFRLIQRLKRTPRFKP